MALNTMTAGHRSIPDPGSPTLERDRLSSTGMPTGRRDLLAWLFPRGVRLWHFIVLPALGMGIVIGVFNLLDAALLHRLGPTAAALYGGARPIAISGMMAGLIGWLAFRHRRGYESKLMARQIALEDTRDFLASIIEGSGEAIVTRDARGRVTSWNRAAEEIYGWNAAEMLGQRVERLLPDDPDHLRQVEDNDRRLREGRTIRDFETVRLRKDGSRIVVRVTRSPLYDADGNFVGSTGIIHDVTRLKEMEARLLERETLAALGEMAAQVAHEIKNPLTGIRGACEILSEGFDREHPHREIADEVVRQMDRLNRSVEDLLLFSRPKALDAQPSDLHQVIDRALRVASEDPRAGSVSIERCYDASLPPLRVDPRQLEQVFLNIVLNAMQAMDYRGGIRVSTEARDGEIRVRFADSGPGIPPTVADRVFKPFFTTRAKGTGLGLAIVKNIVEAHGGTVSATNRPESGAEILIVLPGER